MPRCIRASTRRVYRDSGQAIRKYMTPASKNKCMGKIDIIDRSLARNIRSGTEISEQMEVSLSSAIA